MIFDIENIKKKVFLVKFIRAKNNRKPSFSIQWCTEYLTLKAGMEIKAW